MVEGTLPLVLLKSLHVGVKGDAGDDGSRQANLNIFVKATDECVKAMSHWGSSNAHNHFIAC